MPLPQVSVQKADAHLGHRHGEELPREVLEGSDRPQISVQKPDANLGHRHFARFTHQTRDFRADVFAVPDVFAVSDFLPVLRRGRRIALTLPLGPPPQKN